MLVGREKETNQLMKQLNYILEGNSSVVFIGGEAGVGKTRLANEFIKKAEEKHGIKTFTGWCLSEAKVPYFPFIEAFNQYVSNLKNQEAKNNISDRIGLTGWLRGPERVLQPEVKGLSLTPSIEKERTFDAVAKIFLDLTQEEPHILFFDDLQWADQLSLAMIHYLTKRCRNSKLLILGTYRTEELSQGEEAVHPLMETILSLTREGFYEEINLNRLELENLPDLLNSIFNTSYSKEFVELLYRETEGNPLFTIETLNLLVEEGFLLEEDGKWRLTAPIKSIGIPSKIQGVITRRLLKLGRDQRKILDVAAVSGRTINPEILSRVLSMNIVNVFESLVDIERRFNLIQSVGHVFEFTHQKIREVIYEDLQAGLRRIYHLQTADTLEQVLSEKVSNGFLAEVAHHYLQGESPEKAFRYLIVLGEKAEKLYANDEAIEYLTKALEITHKHPNLATPENLYKIYKARGSALKTAESDAGTPQNAMKDFTAMFEAAAKTGDEKIMAEAYMAMGSAYNPFFDNLDNRLKYLLPGLELIQKIGDKSLESLIKVQIGTTYMLNPETEEKGIKRLEEASILASGTGNKLAESYSLRQLALNYKNKGDFPLAKERLIRSTALMEEIQEPYSLVWRYFQKGIVHAELGEYDDAIYYAEKGLKMAQEYEITPVAWILNTLGWIYYQLGNIELAVKYCNDCLEYARQQGKKLALGGIPYSLMILGTIYIDERDIVKAEENLEEALKTSHLHARKPGKYSRLRFIIKLRLCELMLLKGKHDQALKELE
jgi:tetratricopeptide (TPR) repeat protein